MEIGWKTAASLVALMPALAASVAGAAEAQRYAVDISSTASPQMDAALQASSQLVTLQGAGALPPFALMLPRYEVRQTATHGWRR